MSLNLWKKCGGETNIRRLTAKPWRAVEAQHKVVTRKLVESLEEQLILEELLESNKPEYSNEIDNKLHYLLSTPFRYPPLKHGSRYGTRQQRGIWYGSVKIKTALSEVAYYRFLFLQGSEAELGEVYADFTLFKSSVKTQKGVDLTREPFLKHKTKLTHFSNYELSQELGNRMRENGVQAIRCFSARDKDNGINIAVFNSTAFDQNSPLEFEHWHCIATSQRVEFVKRDLIKPIILKFHSIEFFN